MGVSLSKLYSLAEQYGIPAQAVNAILAFALVLLFGRPIIKIFMRLTFRRMDELSEETRSSYIGLIHMASIILITLAAILSPLLAGGLSVLMLIVLPLAVGAVASKGGAVKSTPVQPIKPKKEESLEEKLRRKAKPPKVEKTEKKKEKEKKQEDEKKAKKSTKISFKFPFLGGASGKKEKKNREQKRVKEEKSAPTLRVEEIKIPVQAPMQPLSPTPTRTPLAQPAQPNQDDETPKLPPADKIKREEFLRAVAELESQASGAPPTQVPSQPPQPAGVAPNVEEKYVEQVARVVEEKVVQSRKHKFTTWREAREMRKRAKEAVQRMKPVVKQKVKETLQKKGTLTKEDLDAIAEEILYQVQKGDVFAREEPPKPTEEGKRKQRERKKKEEKEEPATADEDILALLGGEEGETGEDLLGGEDEDFEELKKLLEE